LGCNLALKAFSDNVGSFENEKGHLVGWFEGFSFVLTLSESNLRIDLSKSLDVFRKYAQNQNVIK
jgi:hypothetical protein